MSEAEFIFRYLNTHQVLIIVVDTRILGCVADSLQQCCFASISPADYKYAKVSIFRPEVIWTKVAHGRWGLIIKGKETAWERWCTNLVNMFSSPRLHYESACCEHQRQTKKYKYKRLDGYTEENIIKGEDIPYVTRIVSKVNMLFQNKTKLEKVWTIIDTLCFEK